MAQRKQSGNLKTKEDRGKYELTVYEWTYLCILNSIENLQSPNISTLVNAIQNRDDIMFPQGDTLSDLLYAFEEYGAVKKSTDGIYSMLPKGKELIKKLESCLV